uniref:Uncharacterized protein n=1 Tax=Peronospora matthiolae TaxID=2874970 RepID=A0AAV1VC62_9STRA
MWGSRAHSSTLWVYGCPTKGSGGIEVMESNLQDVEDLAKPSSSVAEMRQMAKDRLFVQNLPRKQLKPPYLQQGLRLLPRLFLVTLLAGLRSGLGRYIPQKVEPLLL